MSIAAFRLAGCLSITRIGKNHAFGSFFPSRLLSRVFRGKFVADFKQAFRDGLLNFHGSLTPLAPPKIFTSWLRSLFRKDWVVYAKRPSVARNMCSSIWAATPIANHRLVSFVDGQVTFRWRDSAHNNEQKC